MINEQRWKTNYIGLLEAGNCFYENVNCVCQADTRSGGRAERGQGSEATMGLLIGRLLLPCLRLLACLRMPRLAPYLGFWTPGVP